MTEKFGIEEVSSLAVDAALELAVIHMASLPDSSLTRMGEKASAAFYRFVAGSNKEKLFVFKNAQGERVAACILSFSPDTIKRRMIFNIPMALSLVTALLKKPGNSSSSDLGTGPELGKEELEDYDQLPLSDTLPQAPEVLHIFADSSCRGTGIGRKLMAAAEQVVYKSGQIQIVVRTQASETNPALKFYRSLDYTPLGKSADKSKNLILLGKLLQG